jgi:hypothetical protein
MPIAGCAAAQRPTTTPAANTPATGPTAPACHPAVSVSIREKPRALVHITGAGLPHEPVTLHADASPPGGSLVWSASDPTIVRVFGAGDTASIAGLSPGTTTVTVTYTYLGQTATDSTQVLAYQVVIEHPSGDPVAAGSATNEFTYSAASPGVLTIQCKALVQPDDAEARAQVETNVRWSIDPVGESSLVWTPADPSDATRGTGLTATAKFTGLPRRNEAFGAKKIVLKVEGCACRAITTIEVFWPKNAKNHPPDGLVHPGGTAPNWFYYWRQVIGEGNMQHVRYGGHDAGGNLGATPAMLNWSYAAGQNKKRILMLDPSAMADNAVPLIHGRRTGIDLFRIVFQHESEHVRQVAQADAVVGAAAGTCWQFGWSWNQANHNHWRLGPGRVAGAGGICGPAGPGTMGAPGSGDVSLQDPAGFDWPLAFGAMPALPWAFGHPLEEMASRQEKGLEHALARYDWGDPGKNHRTRNKFDD